MKGMRKNRLYRIGAGLLAGLLVFTGVPQTVSMAEENDLIVSQQPEMEQDLTDTEDAYEDMYIKDEPDAAQEDDFLVTPDADMLREDSVTVQAATPVVQAAADEGSVKIETTGDGWSTEDGIGVFSLQRSSSTPDVVYDENSKIITATLNLPEGGSDPEAELASLTVEWYADNNRVTFNEQPRMGNQIRVKVTAGNTPDVTDIIYVHVTGSVQRQDGTSTDAEGNVIPNYITKTINYTDSCKVKITKLLLREIRLDSRLTGSDGVKDLQAGDPNETYYDVFFMPADADDIGGAQVLYSQTSDQTHVEATLVPPSSDDSGYKLKLKAINVGNATIHIQASNIESLPFTVYVSEFYPVPLTGFDLKEQNPSGDWVTISPSTPYEMGEGTSTRFRVYYTPSNTTEKEVTVAPGSDLLGIAQVGASVDGDYVEYQVTARRLTDSDEIDANDFASETITVKPINTAGNISAKNYTIKIKKERHPVTGILVSPDMLEIKNRGTDSTGRFTISVAPQNADNKEIVLTSDRPILVRKVGEADYTEVSSTTPLRVEATSSSSGGQSAVCNFEVKAAQSNDTGAFVITARSGDTSYAGSVTITVNVSNHSIENIELSPTSLTVYETPETGYEPEDLKEIEAQIDPIEAENRMIIWTIAPADGSAADAAAHIVDEENNRLVTTIKTDADESTGKTAVKIIGLRRGECIVTAKSEEAETVIAQCRVIVTTGRYSVESIDLLDEAGQVIDLETIAMRPSSILDLRARVNPTTAINAELTVSQTGSALRASKGETEDGITPIFVTSNTEENGNGDKVTVRAGGRDKSIFVQIKEPYMEFGQRELHYAPDEVSEAAIRNDLTVRFYKIKALDPASYELVTDYDLTLITKEGDHLTQESANWANELSKPGEKTLRVGFIYTEDGIDYPYEKDITLVVSRYPLVDLVRVINPDKVWNVANGISLASMTLPTQVDITVRDHYEDSSESDRRMRADVTWNRTSDRYDPNSKEEQNFTLNGTATLPEGVRNPSGASLAVQVEVNVREAMTAGRKVEKPEVSVENGVTLAYGSTISLSCATVGATIYYTLDGTEATRDGLRYTAPIRLTEATTVLRAIAYMEGWQDSDPVKIVVYLDAAAAVDPIDPDDPDAPTPDDVTPEDKELIGGKTDGLWAVIQDAEGREEKIAVFAYTGNALKPVVHVYDGTKLLKEKKDYTVSYRNNKNAGGPGTTDKYPAVIITGKGNYDGKIEVPFIIKPVSIKDDSVMMDDAVAAAYNKKAQKPTPKLTWNGKTLTKNKDYTYDEVSYKEPGIYKVQVTGVGNYTDSRVLTYEIYEHGVPASKFTVSKVTDQKYTGNRITPAVTVKYNDVKLTAGVNYEIRYENNLNVGTASVYIIGQGGYKGSKRINFKILPIADMKNVAAVLTFDPATPVYEGKAVKPASYTLTYQTKNLREGEDYTVSYLNNDKAGTATVVFTGKGPFKGTLKKKFQIGKASIFKANIEMATSYPYQKGGCKPKPRVVLGDRVLEEGTDYTLSYKNIGKIGNTAQVIVKGKGSYTGSVPKYFTITVQDIANLKVVAADKVYQDRKNAYKTKVEVFDLNGKKLEAGRDYSEEIIYTYASGEKKDQPILSSDILPAGTRVQVEVRVTNPKYYRGTAYGTYRIVQANIKNAKVKVLDQEYTGKKVKPNKSQINSITLDGVPLTDYDYEIVSYQNNINQGTAKMTIRGIGDYGGTKDVTFKIKRKGILSLRF